MKRRASELALRLVPAASRPAARLRLRRWRRPAFLGTLRRTTPLSERWGSDRGTPVDRHYIERFLEEHRSDIHGRVLEVKDSSYTKRFGTDVSASEVLDIDRTNQQATLFGDLGVPGSIVAEPFDCVVLTQTLQYVEGLAAAVESCHALLNPGGVLLATVPALSRSSREEDELPDYWRFTTVGCKALFEKAFGAANVTVVPHGNVLSAIAFLTGMAQEELRASELAAHDSRFPLIIAVRAVRQ
ncbi:MAG: hypothetical protein QOH73_1031 [Gaiellaceae bacterium]|jgi:SAM-dependent methyltransferase|nr:hypothetical protein [Gaiellaceae bacterium]